MASIDPIVVKNVFNVKGPKNRLFIYFYNVEFYRDYSYYEICRKNKAFTFYHKFNITPIKSVRVFFFFLVTGQ